MASMGRNKYPMIVRDDCSRHAWIYFVSHKYKVRKAAVLSFFWAFVRKLDDRVD